MAGRPSSLITHNAFRPISDPPPSAGTPVPRKSFIASRIPGLTEEVPGSALRRRGLPPGSSGIQPALESGPRWLARRRTSRRVKEARADHKVRASSGMSERDEEWLEPVFIPHVRHCLQIHARHDVPPANRQATDFQEAVRMACPLHACQRRNLGSLSGQPRCTGLPAYQQADPLRKPISTQRAANRG